MTSGVYDRGTLGREFHGLRRLRMVRRYNGVGTDAVVEAKCSACGCAVERSASAVRLARREGRSFVCKLCNVARTLEIRRAKGGTP